MDPLVSFGLAIVVSLFVSSVINWVMTPPLRAALRLLCLQADAPAFWLPFTTVMFYIAPLLFTMLFEGTLLVPSVVSTVRTALASSLFGAFAALLVIGYQIAKARPTGR